MKPVHIVLGGLLALAPVPALSCDFCNCLMGINPYYSTSDQFTIHYLYQRSTSGSASGPVVPHLKPAAGSGLLHGVEPPRPYHGGHTGGDETIMERETRSTFELAYRHHFSQNFMATAVLPVTLLDVESTGRLSVKGTGDPMVMAHYIMPNLLPDGPSTVLLLGAGVKAPLGDYMLRDGSGERLDPRLQPGSGSVDLVLNGTMTLQSEGWTFAADLFGKINTSNPERDRIGNSLALSSTVNRDLYRDNEEEFAVVGIAGLRGESAARDRVEGVIDERSGFLSGYTTLGGQIAYRSVRLDLSAMLPVYQHRNDPSSSEGVRFVTGLRLEL